MIDIKEEVNKEELNNDDLKSCCFTCNFKAFLFIAQFIFSIIIFSVSIVMILLDNNTSLFVSLLSLVVGIWLPPPQHPTNDKK